MRRQVGQISSCTSHGSLDSCVPLSLNTVSSLQGQSGPCSSLPPHPGALGGGGRASTLSYMLVESSRSCNISRWLKPLTKAPHYPHGLDHKNFKRSLSNRLLTQPSLREAESGQATCPR